MEDSALKYWDTQWAKRIRPDNIVEMNPAKLKRLLYELTNRPIYAAKQKLEIGCGPAMHARMLCKMNPWWRERWIGIDPSETAIAYARKNSMDAHVSTMEDFSSDVKYGVFLFLDVFEHLENRDAVADKIRELGDTSYIIFGNIPLYVSQHALEKGVEFPTNMGDVVEFLVRAGCISGVWCNVYGIGGLPYCTFEASTDGVIQHDGQIITNENTIALPAMGK